MNSSSKGISSFYRGPWRYLSILFILLVAVGGALYPVVGLIVPGLILLALASNMVSRRWFCRSACPNGRALSSGLGSISRRTKLPKRLSSKGFRQALCAFMLFCLVNLLLRFGGGVEASARVFWAVYLISIGISIPMGIYFRPRAWCALCPMGTLQSTVAQARES